MLFFKKSKPVSRTASQSRGQRLRPNAAVTTRIVPEKRWLHRNQLEIGMYVNELDKPWEETRFMFQGFQIDSQEMLHAVQESCEYACVQTEKLALISSNSPQRLVGATRR